MIKSNNTEVLCLDGSHGEGGGQILRTALSLSCVTGRAVEIENIRRSRRKPGLQPQHLMSVLAAARICGATVEGASISSPALLFKPGPVRAGDYRFDISNLVSSAGSTSLVFQTVLLPLLLADGSSTVLIHGGTHVPWSPSFHYLRHVFLPLLFRMNTRVQLSLRQWGWYPRGGGVISAGIEPCRKFRSLSIEERGAFKGVRGISAISNLADHIAERQRSRAIRNLNKRGIQADIGIEHGPSIGRGTALLLVSEFENIIAGFGSLGALGKKAETVADEACAELFEYVDAKGCLDPHLTDQVVPYLALANGPSEITTSNITPHLLTNIWVVQQFLETGISVHRREGEPGTIRVSGFPGASERSSTV